MNRTLRLVFLLLLAALSACSWMRAGWEEPQVDIAALRMGPSEGLYQRIFVDLIITNPNRNQLGIDGIRYNVRIEGHELVKGVSRDPLTVAPGASVRYTIPAGFSLLSGAGLVRDLLTRPREQLRYELEATIDPSGWLGPDITVRRSDFIALPQPNS